MIGLQQFQIQYIKLAADKMHIERLRIMGGEGDFMGVMRALCHDS